MLLLSFVVVATGFAAFAVDAHLETSTCSVPDDLTGTCLLQKRKPSAINSKATVEEDLSDLTKESKEAKRGKIEGHESQHSPKSTSKRDPPVAKLSENSSVPRAHSAKSANQSAAHLDNADLQDIEDVLVHPKDVPPAEPSEKLEILGSKVNDTFKGGALDLESTAADNAEHLVSVKHQQRHRHMHLVQQALLGAPIVFLFGGSLAACGFLAGKQKGRAESQSEAEEKEDAAGGSGQRSTAPRMSAKPRASLLESDESANSDEGSCAGMGLAKTTGRGLDFGTPVAQNSNARHPSHRVAKGSAASSSASGSNNGSALSHKDNCGAYKALPRWKKNPQHCARACSADASSVKADDEQDVHETAPRSDQTDEAKRDSILAATEELLPSEPPCPAPHGEGESPDADELREGKEGKNDCANLDQNDMASLDSSSLGEAQHATTHKPAESFPEQKPAQTEVFANGQDASEAQGAGVKEAEDQGG